MKRVLFPVLAAAVAATLAAPAMSALLTFATYQGDITGFGTKNIQYANGATTDVLTAITTAPSGAVTDANRAIVSFSYSSNVGPTLSATPVLAYMTFNLTSATPASDIDDINQVYSGSITFTPVANSAVGSSFAYTTSSNLLTVDLINSQLVRNSSLRAFSDGTGAYYKADGTTVNPAYRGNKVDFSSDFLTFNNPATATRQSSLTFTGDTDNAAGTGFTADSSGLFASDPAPNANVTSAVPETASWAMMLVGFGAVGGALRSSRGRKTGLLVS